MLSKLLLVVILAAALVPPPSSVLAGDHIDQFDAVDMVEMIFYPFVPNGHLIGDAGPWHGSVTVQNLEEHDVIIWALPDAGFDPENAYGTYVIAPGGAITLSATQLELDEPGSPIAIAAVFRAIWEADDEEQHNVADGICGSPSSSGLVDVWVYTCKPAIAGIARMAAPDPMSGPTGNRTGAAHVSVDGYNAIPAQDVAWGSQSEFCAALWGGWPDQCSGVGSYDPLGFGIGFQFDGHSYLPIVQTNSGWNAVLHVSNIDPSAWSGQVNVRLIATEQVASPASRSDSIALERTLRPGETWTIDLKGEGIPEGWIGSAHITSNIGVVASSLRFKPETGMLMTNVSAPSLLATTSLGTEDQGEYQAAGNDVAPYQSVGSSGFEMYAPLVFLNFNGWNTGISILNIAEMTNAVTATFYGPDGNVYWADLVTIAPRGQRFIHLPAPEESGVDTGWVGSLVLSAPFEFHAAIDQIKYSTGEAMSYMATAAGARAQSSGDPWPNADTLSLPLVQKGHLDGSGDTSGIQLFNASMNGPVDVEIEFRSQVGNVIPPTQTVPLRMTIPPMGSQTIHAMDLGEMAPNTAGTATVRITGGEGQLVGVSNLVNYAVESDGSAAFNLVNTFGQYRFPVSQTTSLTPP